MAADLVLDAWGGPVKDGEECFVFDKKRFLYRRVDRAKLVQMEEEIGLLVDNQVHRWFDVARTEERARQQLIEHAEFVQRFSLDRLDVANAALLELKSKEAEPCPTP